MSLTEKGIDLFYICDEVVGESILFYGFVLVILRIYEKVCVCLVNGRSVVGILANTLVVITFRFRRDAQVGHKQKPFNY